jgi:hypothetical protein
LSGIKRFSKIDRISVLKNLSDFSKLNFVNEVDSSLKTQDIDSLLNPVLVNEERIYEDPQSLDIWLILIEKILLSKMINTNNLVRIFDTLKDIGIFVLVRNSEDSRYAHFAVQFSSGNIKEYLCNYNCSLPLKLTFQIISKLIRNFELCIKILKEMVFYDLIRAFKAHYKSMHFDEFASLVSQQLETIFVRPEAEVASRDNNENIQLLSRELFFASSIIKQTFVPLTKELLSLVTSLDFCKKMQIIESQREKILYMFIIEGSPNALHITPSSSHHDTRLKNKKTVVSNDKSDAHGLNTNSYLLDSLLGPTNDPNFKHTENLQSFMQKLTKMNRKIGHFASYLIQAWAKPLNVNRYLSKVHFFFTQSELRVLKLFENDQESFEFQLVSPERLSQQFFNLALQIQNGESEEVIEIQVFEIKRILDKIIALFELESSQTFKQKLQTKLSAAVFNAAILDFLKPKNLNRATTVLITTILSLLEKYCAGNLGHCLQAKDRLFDFCELLDHNINCTSLIFVILSQLYQSRFSFIVPCVYKFVLVKILSFCNFELHRLQVLKAKKYDPQAELGRRVSVMKGLSRAKETLSILIRKKKPPACQCT